MNIKNTLHHKKISALFISALSILPAASAAAAVTPVLLTGQSTLQEVGINASNLSSLLGTVFNLGVALAVVLALIMIILGGVQMMTTDSWEKHSEGKSRIENALWGLGLALVSWLILYTINPTLVTFNGNLLLGTGK